MAQRVPKPTGKSARVMSDTQRVAIWCGWLLILIGLAFAASTMLPFFTQFTMPIIVVIPMVVLCAVAALIIAVFNRRVLLGIAAIITAVAPWWIALVAMFIVF